MPYVRKKNFKKIVKTELYFKSTTLFLFEKYEFIYFELNTDIFLNFGKYIFLNAIIKRGGKENI